MFNWRTTLFEDLSSNEIVDIFALRQQVFIIEQQCIYADIDGLDAEATHVLATQINPAGAEQLVAYARILDAGVKYPEVAIGRVIVYEPYRHQGLGTELIKQSVAYIQAAKPNTAIRLSAQLQLEKFYNNLGFHGVSAPYDEDGISHIDMLKTTTSNAQ